MLHCCCASQASTLVQGQGWTLVKMQTHTSCPSAREGAGVSPSLPETQDRVLVYSVLSCSCPCACPPPCPCLAPAPAPVPALPMLPALSLPALSLPALSLPRPCPCLPGPCTCLAHSPNLAPVLCHVSAPALNPPPVRWLKLSQCIQQPEMQERLQCRPCAISCAEKLPDCAAAEGCVRATQPLHQSCKQLFALHQKRTRDRPQVAAQHAFLHIISCSAP